MIDFSVYRKLLADPTLARSIAWSFPARLPLGMNSLALVLTTQHVTGNFTSAGAVTACYLTSNALVSPFIGRYIDQNGPGRVVPLCALLSGFVMLLIAFVPGITLPLMITFAILAGASLPPVTSLIRAMWQKANLSDGDRRAALSLDATILEATFMFGPLMVGAFVAFQAPRLACAVSGLVGALGVWRFLHAGGAGKWGRVETHVERHALGPLQSSAFMTLLLVCVCFCAGLSCNELVFTAFTQAIGIPGAVGWLYFVACVSSGLASLMFGTRTFAWPLSRLLSLFALYTAATFAAMALATSFWTMMLLAFLSGAAVGPGIASLYTLAGQYSQSRYITEAMTWMISTLLVGLGIGLALGGWAIDTWGWKWTAVFSAAPAVLAACVACALPALRPTTRQT